MGRVGIYPGSFDPIHDGHISFARKAVQEMSLDEVIFLPESSPRIKTPISSLPLRMKRLRRSIIDDDSLRVVALEDMTFTIRATLPKLQKTLVGEELYLLIGSDVARHLGSWPGIEKLCKEVNFIVAMRNDDSRLELTKLFESLDARFYILESPRPHLASSKIMKLSRAAKRLLVDFST